jgi:hypothetical protein
MATYSQRNTLDKINFEAQQTRISFFIFQILNDEVRKMTSA